MELSKKGELDSRVAQKEEGASRGEELERGKIKIFFHPISESLINSGKVGQQLNSDLWFVDV